ncbi:MAG: PHP domain-containing protein [bacterium]
MHLCEGAIHIHSKHSDGTSTIPEIAKYAKKAGLKWIVITDHNNLDGLEEEGWHDGVAVIIGQETSPPTSDHFLALGLNEVISEKLSPQEVINETNNKGGFGFIAHPAESKSRKNNIRPLRWTDQSVKGFYGLEIWNHLSDWADNYHEKIGIYSLLRREHILKGPQLEVMQWWDKLNNDHSVIIPAIGGLDVHALMFGPICVFPYLTSFKTLTNFLCLEENLSDDFNLAKIQVLKALKDGKNLIINRSKSKKSQNVEFYAFTEKYKAFSGYDLEFCHNFSICIKLPKKAKINLYCNGERQEQINSNKLIYRGNKSGKYRFEAYVNGKPWIFSNPVNVRQQI